MAVFKKDPDHGNPARETPVGEIPVRGTPVRRTMIRRILNGALIVAVAGVVAVWAYMLNQDFQGLPADTVSLRYSVFNIKVLLFALFLIASITIVYYLNAIMDRKSPRDESSAPGGEDAARILDRIEDLKKSLHRPAGAPEPAKGHSDASPEEKAIRKLEPALKLLWVKTVGELFSQTVETASELTGARRVSLFLYGRDNKKLYSVKTLGSFPQDPAGRGPIEAEEGISWYVFQQGKRLFATNIESHPEIARKNKPQYSTRSLIVIPLKIFGDEKVGVLNLSEKTGDGGVFSKADLELASLIGYYFESRMENFVLYQSVDDLCRDRAEKQ